VSYRVPRLFRLTYKINDRLLRTTRRPILLEPASTLLRHIPLPATIPFVDILSLASSNGLLTIEH
jgi:hypothetical protein